MINEILNNKVRRIVEKNGIKECIRFFNGYDIICKVYGWTDDDVFNAYFKECHPDYFFNVIRYNMTKYDVSVNVWNEDGDVIIQISESGQAFIIADKIIFELEDVFGDTYNVLLINWFNSEYGDMLKDVFGENYSVKSIY